jgi:hypothetical protein
MALRILTIILPLLLACFACAATPTDFEYGSRPPLAVFDPTGVLNSEDLKAISDPLATLYQNENIDVLVVTLADLAGAPPEQVARQFSESWKKADMHVVVLHVPGRKDSPRIVPFGKWLDLIEPRAIQRAIDESESRAAREITEPEKIRTAANEAANMLRYWTKHVIDRREMIQTENLKLRKQVEERNRNLRMAILLALAAVIPFVIGISLLVITLRKRGPLFFPNRAWHPRLGAPYAGGNHVVVNLRPEEPAPPAL